MAMETSVYMEDALAAKPWLSRSEDGARERDAQVLALVIVGALTLIIMAVVAAHGSAVTCGGASKAGFDCAAEEARIAQGGTVLLHCHWLSWTATP